MDSKLRERRERLEMTQEELALKSGVSRQTISAIENNADKNVSIRVLEMLAKALDTTIGKLFFND